MIQPKDPRYKDLDTMTLSLDDGSRLECLVISVFTIHDKQYIALLPMNNDGSVDEDADFYLYGFQELENEDCALEDIEDDEEFEMVSFYFESMLEGS